MVELIWPGLLAAVVTWLSNFVLLKFVRSARVVVFLAPAVEESAKTGFAVLLGSPVWLAHLAFGFLEALWDVLGGGRRGIYAGMAGLAGHAFFGLAAFFLLQAGGALWLAVAGAYLLHVGWNALICWLS